MWQNVKLLILNPGGASNNTTSWLERVKQEHQADTARDRAGCSWTGRGTTRNVVCLTRNGSVSKLFQHAVAQDRPCSQRTHTQTLCVQFAVVNTIELCVASTALSTLHTALEQMKYLLLP